MASVWIASFLVLGALFGLMTFHIRHWFSEGPAAPAGGDGGGLTARLLWVGVAATLWPVLAVSGLYAVWRRALRRPGR